jgi:hypothetical protein
VAEGSSLFQPVVQSALQFLLDTRRALTGRPRSSDFGDLSGTVRPDDHAVWRRILPQCDQV